MMVLWRVYSGRVDQKQRVSYSQVGEYATKREAVYAMARIRKPKTAILRVGRDYTITAE